MFQRNRTHLKNKYRLTEDAYRDLLINQHFKCKICQTKPKNGKFDIDHCHKTGKIRGLLCRQCNIGLGRFEKGRWNTSHLIDPVKEYTAYLNAHVILESRIGKAAWRILYANRYS